MAEPTGFEYGFPTGGVVQATSYEDQPTNTSPDALNVWPYYYPDGRYMGGTRPGLTSASFPAYTPYNWCPAVWSGGRGIAVTTSSGTIVSTDSNNWSAVDGISTAPGSSFSSCAVFNGVLFQASAATGAVVRWRKLGTTETGTLEEAFYPPPPNGTGGSKGVPPTGCGLVYAHGGAIWLAGQATNPHVLYRSAINDYTDWQTARTDEGAAWSSAGVRGQINRPIVGLMTHGNGCLLVGHVDAITVVRGDPQLNGAVEEIDQYAGPIMQSAWCKTGDDSTAILTREELNFMAPGCGSPRISMSRFKLPAALAAINPGNGDTASLSYDGRFNGLMIFVKRKTGVVEGNPVYAYTEYFFDLAGKGFFPMQFASGQFLLGATFTDLIDSTRGATVALKSGGGSYFDTDSTENISSYVVIGPIPLGNAILDGIMSRIAFVAARGSSDISFEIYSGPSAHEALYGGRRYPPSAAGTITRAGLNYSHHPRLVDNVAYVKLSATGTARWAIEKIVGETYLKRRRRVMRNGT